jgi:hypothetical protein
MKKDLFRASIEAMSDRDTFTFPELVAQSGQTIAYKNNPKGEGKRFWTQVACGEFDTKEYKIRLVIVKTGPQKYQKCAVDLDQPIPAPNIDASVRSVNELLFSLGKVLAIVPLKHNTDSAA